MPKDLGPVAQAEWKRVVKELFRPPCRHQPNSLMLQYKARGAPALWFAGVTCNIASARDSLTLKNRASFHPPIRMDQIWLRKRPRHRLCPTPLRLQD